MTIVPNLNGVPISSQVPLVDPRNLTYKERTINDDNYSSSTTLTLVNGNQAAVAASPLRNNILVMNPLETNNTVYISMSVMTAAGQGIPIYPGNGYQFRGKAAQQGYYCWGVTGQALVVMVG